MKKQPPGDGADRASYILGITKTALKNTTMVSNSGVFKLDYSGV